MNAGFVPARFEQAAVSAQARFAGLGGAGGSNLLLIPEVLYTVSLGQDRTDPERVVFVAIFEFASGAGAVGSVLLSNQVRGLGAAGSQVDVEIQAAWLSRPGGSLGVGWQFQNSDLPDAFAAGTSSTDGSVAAACAASRAAASVLAHGFSVPASTVLFLPVEAYIIPPGRQIMVEGDANAANYQGGFVWRELPRGRS